MRFHIPIKLPSLANERMHWRKLSALKKRQRSAVQTCMGLLVTVGDKIPSLPITVTITRVGPRKLDDDNLASSCKYVRDQIATIIGLDDGSDQYTWQYRQKIGKYGVDVEVTSRQRGPPLPQ